MVLTLDGRVLSVSSFAKAARLLRRPALNQNIDVISFDVFDTLLFRRCSPETVLLGTALSLCRMLGRPQRDAEWVLEERYRAYIELASHNQEQGLDFECGVAALHTAWARRLAPDDRALQSALARQARESERRYEGWACLPNKILVPVIGELKQRGIRLVFVSDMYLGEALVSELMERNGLRDLFDAGYVSGDHALLKRSGRLFKHMVEREGQSSERILHVGDDPWSDGAQASAEGLRSLVIRDRGEIRRRRQLLFDNRQSRQEPGWSGVAAAAFVASGVDGGLSAAESAGRDLLGPIFANFIHGLAEFCDRVRPDAVWFFSREGLLLRELYDQMVETLELPLPRGGYLCVSRLSTALASMRRYGMREVSAAVTATYQAAPRHLLAPLAFPQEQLDHLATVCGLADLDTPQGLLRSPALVRLLDHPEVQEQARRRGAEARQSLRAYLYAQGFFRARRVVLVDVGWGAQIQESLELALAGESGPEIHGYYLGADRLADERRRAGLRVYADLVDAAHYDWAGGSAFDFVQLFEAASRAPHGTVVGYRDNAPVLLDDQHPERRPELADEPRIALLQQGIRDYSKNYARYAAITGMPAAHTRSHARTQMVRVIRLPRSPERRLFASLTNVANFGSAESQYLAGTPPLFRPLRFIKELDKALWSEGAAASRLGRWGALLLSVAKAPRTRRRLPRQSPENPLSGRPESNPPPSLQTAPNHAFEAVAEERSATLVRLQRSIEPLHAPRPALTLGELVSLRVAHRLVNFCLRVSSLAPVPAELLSPRNWVARLVCVYWPSRGFAGRLSRLARRMRGEG